MSNSEKYIIKGSCFGSAVHPAGGAGSQSYLAISHPSKVIFFGLKTAMYTYTYEQP